VDGFFAGSKNPLTTQFIQDYTKYFHSAPGTIEVQAFDAGSILRKVIGENHPENRVKLRDQLLSQGKYTGISGEFVFTPEGVKRGAHLLTVKGNAIAEIAPSAEAQN
jgi:hypothetical protein